MSDSLRSSKAQSFTGSFCNWSSLDIYSTPSKPLLKPPRLRSNLPINEAFQIWINFLTCRHSNANSYLPFITDCSYIVFPLTSGPGPVFKWIFFNVEKNLTVSLETNLDFKFAKRLQWIIHMTNCSLFSTIKYCLCCGIK